MSYAIPIGELIKDVPDEHLKLIDVPTWLKHVVHAFGVSDLRSYWDDQHLIYEGRLRLLLPKDRITLPWGKWRFIFPILDKGLPFTLWVVREGKADATTLDAAEPPAEHYQLLIQLPTLTLQCDPEVVRPAVLHTEPQFYMQPVKGEAPRLTLPQVSLYFDSKKGLTFAACQSWEDLAQQAGDFILQTQLQPRYVTILDAIGLGLDRVILDLSAARTPAAVQRIPGHGPGWQGLYLDELLICAPVNMPHLAFAARAQDFVIGFDGLISGQFTAEFAKSDALSDGRLKFASVDLVDEQGASLGPVDAVAGEYVDEYRLRRPAQRKAQFKVKATVSAKEGTRLLWTLRVDGKDALTGQTRAVDATRKAVVETDLYEVGDGLHQVGLYVAEKPPVASGVRYATSLAVTVATNAFQHAPVEVTVTRPRRAYSASSSTHVEGVAPLAIEAVHPVQLPTDHTIERTWTLTSVPATSTDVQRGTERFRLTIHLPAKYALTLEYKVLKSGAPVGQPRKRTVTIDILETAGDAMLDDAFFSPNDALAYRGRTVTLNGLDQSVGVAPTLRTCTPTPADLKALLAQQITLPELLTRSAASTRLVPGDQVAVDQLLGTPPQITFPTARDAISLLDVVLTRQGAGVATTVPLKVSACFAKDKTRTLKSGAVPQPVRDLADHIRRNAQVTHVTFVVHDVEFLQRGQALHDALGALLTEPPTEEPKWEQIANLPAPRYRLGARVVEITWTHPAQQPSGVSARPDKDTVIAVVRCLGGQGALSATRRLVLLPLQQQADKLPARATPPPTPALFKRSWFRRLRVEMQVLRNAITKGQVEVVADLYDANIPGLGDKAARINDPEGLVRLVAGITRDPVSGRLRIESSYRADPRDKDGLFPFKSATGRPDTALSLMRLYLFALPPAAACSSDAVTRVTATALAAGLVTTLRLLKQQGNPILDVPELTMRAFHLRVETGGKGHDHVVVAADYDCLVHLNFDVMQIKLQTKKPLNVQYRNVGFLFGGEKGFDFFHEPSKGFAIDVRDSGLLTLPGWLSSLLSIMRLRLGIGSPLTVDVELGLKQNLGILKLSSLPITVSILTAPDQNDKRFDVKVGAMRIGMDIPGVLSGSGLIRTEEKRFLGSLQLKLAKPKLHIEADLGFSFQPDYTALYAALYAEWGVGIPLANSGAALYGLAGLFAMHWTRKSAPDAYQWYVNGPVQYSARDIQKWEEKKGNLAFGAGVVIGTLADGGRALNLKGMLILELPGPRFLLAVRATLLNARSKVDDSTEGNITAVVDLDFAANRFLIKLAVRYTVPNVLKLQVPAEAFFELPDPKARRAGSYHIWIGHDKRKELQVRLEVLGMLQAWGYLMIQSDRIESLAGSGVDLPGPCIAFGLRAEFKWGEPSDPIHLLAFIELHVGLGLAPIFFYGMARIGGTLHLFIVGISAWAKLQAQGSEAKGFSLEGHICGSVELLWWKLEGCVEFKLGPEPTFEDPEPLLEGLTFRHRATELPISVPLPPSSDGAQPGREAIGGRPIDEVQTEAHWNALHPVPTDCVPILQFRTGVDGDRPAGSFDLAGNAPGKKCVEKISDRLQYAYTLAELTLQEVHGAGSTARMTPVPAATYPATWPLEQLDRRTTLQLNEWKPILDWTAQEHTAAALPGYATALCERMPDPKRHLYTFQQEPVGPGEVWRLRPDNEPDAPLVTVGCWQKDDVSLALMQAGYQRSALATVTVHTPPGLPAHLQGIGRVLRIPLDGSTLTIEAGELRDVEVRLAGDVGQWSQQITVAGGGMAERIVSDGEACAFVVPAGGVVWLDLSPEGPAGVLTESLQALYLVAIEGRSQPDLEEQQRRERQREAARLTWQHRLTHGTGAGRLLKPGTRYVLQVKVRWERRAFKGEKRDPLPVQSGTDEVALAFRTAGAVPGDLSAYVFETLPAAQAEAHYCDEPQAVRFKSASIHEQIAQYDSRRFVLLAKSERGVAAGDLPTAQLARAARTGDAFQASLVDAMRGAPCLVSAGTENAIEPTVSLTYHPRFAPNTGYTGHLVSLPCDAARLAELTSLDPAELAAVALQDGVRHHSWKFTTSRYASFDDHIWAHEGPTDWILRDPGAQGYAGAQGHAGAQGYAAAIQALLGAQAIAPTERRGDRLLERILYEILGCEAMPPATEAATYRLWLQSGTVQQPAWRCLGLLLDSPEPLFRPGRTRLSIAVGPDASATQRAYALAVNTQGTRALVWSPDLRGDRITLRFTRTRPAVPPSDKELARAASFTTYVLDAPSAYKEET